MRPSGRSAAYIGGYWGMAESLSVRRHTVGRFRKSGVRHLPTLGNQRGPRTALFVVSNRGFQGEEIEIFPLNGFLVSFISAFAPFLRPALDCKLSLPLSSFHKKKKAATR